VRGTFGTAVVYLIVWFASLEPLSWLTSRIPPWWSTHRLWRAGEARSEHELRAYVLVSGGKVTNRLDPTKCIVHMTIRNFGKTPAQEVKWWLAAANREMPLANRPLPSPDESLPMGRTLMGPDNRVEMELAVPEINNLQELALRSGGAAIYAYGKIAYIDAFGKSRQTDFRYMCFGDRLGKGQMAACEDGNNYT
jgi:hypothetical protein